MTTLILHVGPGKCGSSFIQLFFATHKSPCTQKINYKLLDHLLIKGLNQESLDWSDYSDFTIWLNENIGSCDCLILSHEVLFKNPLAIRNICNLADTVASEIIIIGYSRRQSDFMVSQYSQWLFLSPPRKNETSNELVKSGLQTLLFSGIERTIIASILNDFHTARQLSGHPILDWYKSYENIAQLTYNNGAIVKCGVLPDRCKNESLIHDFCRKTNLTLRDGLEAGSEIVVNERKNSNLIEAVDNLVSFDFELPRGHITNKSLKKISSVMKPSFENESEFFINLKSYVDSYYLESNISLCEKFDLETNHFLPAEQISKPQIFDIIKTENQHRLSNMPVIIEKYRTLTATMAETCLELVKDLDK